MKLAFHISPDVPEANTATILVSDDATGDNITFEQRENLLKFLNGDAVAELLWATAGSSKETPK